MAQRAAVGVSVLEFRGVTSLVIVQDSTPKFEAMSIEKSDFTAGSQNILASVFQNGFCECLFFVYCPANFEVAPPLILDKQKAGIAPGPCIKIQFSTKF